MENCNYKRHLENDIPETPQERYDNLLQHYKEYDKKQKAYIEKLKGKIEDLEYFLKDRESYEDELCEHDVLETLRNKIKQQEAMIRSQKKAIAAAKDPRIEQLMNADKLDIIAENVQLAQSEADLKAKVQRFSDTISDLICEKLNPNPQRFEHIVQQLEAYISEENVPTTELTPTVMAND